MMQKIDKFAADLRAMVESILGIKLPEIKDENQKVTKATARKSSKTATKKSTKTSSAKKSNGK